MNLFNKILFYLAVPKCVGCGERLMQNERALCASCLKKHEILKTRNCAECSKPLSSCTCSNDYLKAHYVKRLIKVYRYLNREDQEFPSNNLIYSLKRDNRADVLSFLVEELVTSLMASLKFTDKFIITSVPRRREAIIKYGIDHASLLAKEISKRINIPYVSVLKSTSEKPQKKMRREERIKNATFDYKGHVSLKGRTVIIVDDIVTTGASLGACAILLRGLGAKEIIGCAVSIAYKDKTVITATQPF